MKHASELVSVWQVWLSLSGCIINETKCLSNKLFHHVHVGVLQQLFEIHVHV